MNGIAMLRFFSITCSALAALLVGLVLALDPSITQPRSDAAEESQGLRQPPELEESPHAREEWEWMRLRDPATGNVPYGINRAERAYTATLPHTGTEAFGRRGMTSAEGWIARGPTNVGGRTRALAVDASDDSTLVAGAVSGGMWRSTDVGTTWEPTTSPSQNPNVTCVAQDTRRGKRNIWYFGTGEYRTNSTRFGNTGLPGDGIFKSIDGARAWKPLDATLANTPQIADAPFDYVNTIAIDTSNALQDEVYAACYGAVMRSTDGGTSWHNALGTPGREPGYITLVMAPGGVVYAAFGTGGAAEGIFRSTDGTNWTNISPTFWPDSCRRIVLALAPSNPDVLYVFAETPRSGLVVPGSYGVNEYYSLWKYTYASGNGSGSGGVWSNRSNNLPKYTRAWTVNGLNSYAMCLAVLPDDEDMVVLGCTCLWVSANGFSTPATAEWLGGYDDAGRYGFDGGLHPDVHTIIPAAGGTGNFVGGDGGIFTIQTLKPPATRWDPLTSGYVTSQAYAVALDGSTPGSSRLLIGLQDNGSHLATEDGLVDWRQMYGGDGSFCAFGDSGRRIYVSYQNGTTVRLREAEGGTLQGARIDPAGAGSYLFINPFELDPNNDSVMYMPAGRQLWYNNNLYDIQDDWQLAPATVNWRVLVSAPSTISAIGISTAAPARRVYYGTIDGRIFYNDSPDQPAPKEITGANFPRGAYVNCVAVDPHDGRIALAVFTNYNVQSLFYTEDAGATWVPVGGNLEERPDGTGRGPSCRWAAFLHRGDTRHIYVSTSVGLYSTTTLEGTATRWEQEGAETIGATRVDMIRTRESDGLVAVATWGRGAFTMSVPTSDIVFERSGEGLEMEEIAPNPARTSAVVEFRIPERGTARRVTLSLFDAAGTMLARPVDEVLEPGRHGTRLDFTNGALAALPSGSYYCRLAWGDHALTRRLMVVR